jgi:transposase InsO family protein
MLLQETKIQSILNHQKTVVAVAAELGVSRQTMHKWVARYGRFGSAGLVIGRKKRTDRAHNRTPVEVELLVETLAQRYWKDGVETLHDRLEEENNLALHPVTLYRILKRNNIRYTADYTQTKKRWKKQLFSHQTPGKELQMDTKYPYGYKQGKVIYTIIDDASRWVFAWGYEKPNAENTLDFLKKVLVRFPGNIQKIRTDQGREFIALQVKDFFQNRGIIHRANTPYCPEENGKIERFHRTLNEKAITRGFSPRDSLETMQYKLNLFLHYYNYRKKHRGLGMNGKTPMERLNECASVNLTLQCYKSCDSFLFVV